jgi:hypothetical protein
MNHAGSEERPKFLKSETPKFRIGLHRKREMKKFCFIQNFQCLLDRNVLLLCKRKKVRPFSIQNLICPDIMPKQHRTTISKRAFSQLQTVPPPEGNFLDLSGGSSQV